MKKTFLLIAVLFTFFASSANTSSKYYVNDTQVETLMQESVQVNFDANVENFGVASIQADKNVWVAVALDFFLGGLAIHRVYLGAKPGLIAGYFFTCGGIFGILPLIDLIVLVINSDDISAYVGNSKFFMWN